MRSVYRLIDPRSGLSCYVGETGTSLKTRLYNHLYYTNKGGDMVDLILELRSLGLEPSIELIEECDNSVEVEEYWTWYYLDMGHPLRNGMAGRTRIRPLTDEQCANISNGQVKRWSDNPMTQSMKDSISVSLMGHEQSDETRQKRRESMTGVKRSDENKENNRKAIQLRWARAKSHGFNNLKDLSNYDDHQSN